MKARRGESAKSTTQRGSFSAFAPFTPSSCKSAKLQIALLLLRHARDLPLFRLLQHHHACLTQFKVESTCQKAKILVKAMKCFLNCLSSDSFSAIALSPWMSRDRLQPVFRYVTNSRF